MLGDLIPDAPHQDARLEELLREAVDVGARAAEDAGVPGAIVMPVRLGIERGLRHLLAALGVDTASVRVTADQPPQVIHRRAPHDTET